LCSCQIFANQATWLILQPYLDTAVGKYAKNNEPTDFYVENLVPNQGKKRRPTTRRILPTTRRIFSLTRANGYNAPHPITSNSHANVQHLSTLTHVLVSPRPGQFTQLQKEWIYFLTTPLLAKANCKDNKSSNNFAKTLNNHTHTYKI